MNPQESNPDLESFREQWRAEVRAKHAAPGAPRQQQQQPRAAGPSTTHARTVAQPRGKPPQPVQKQPAAQEEDDDYAQSQSFDEPAAATPASSQPAGRPKSPERGEPVSALEHYEKAVEKEAVGSLGDSLRLYRKAFRLDDSVDQKYKNKHFPKPPPKPTQATPSKDASELASKAEQPQSMKDLIASFSVMSIAPAPPEVEGMPPPPCPLAALPEEILVHILRDVAVLDVGDFMRLARVCKRLAYLVATEDRIWRRICLGSEFGFGGMHYYWQRQVAWGPITEADLLREATEAEEASSAAAADSSAASSETAPPPVLPHPPLTLAERAERHAQESTATTLALYRSLYGRSWQRMFRQRPRIRFNGCYISTVNYLRSGQASPNQATWGSPVHIVTYYRYLRFFRDGTVLSLTETAEPGDVVHHLTREAVAQQSAAVLKQVLKGRWRLASARADADSSNSSSPAGEVVEGDVTVETEGVAKYIYRLDLALGSAGKGARNNKLGWKGFYSYNTLTGDWAEFTMRNNKPFFFSRVRSYGVRGA